MASIVSMLALKWDIGEAQFTREVNENKKIYNENETAMIQEAKDRH